MGLDMIAAGSPTGKDDVLGPELHTANGGVFVGALDVLSRDSSVTGRLQRLVVDGEDQTSYESRGNIRDFAVGQGAHGGYRQRTILTDDGHSRFLICIRRCLINGSQLHCSGDACIDAVLLLVRPWTGSRTITRTEAIAWYTVILRRGHLKMNDRGSLAAKANTRFHFI